MNRKLPAYARKLLDLRKSGKVSSRIVQVVFDWKLARAYPRLVIAEAVPVVDLDFRCLAGLSVQIAYRGRDAHQVDAVVQEILKVRPSFLSTFAVDRVGEDGARALIIPFTKMREAA